MPKRLGLVFGVWFTMRIFCIRCGSGFACGNGDFPGNGLRKILAPLAVPHLAMPTLAELFAISSW